MNIAVALAVVDRLQDETVDEFVKMDAIFSVMNMGTHMSVSEKRLLSIVKWLWQQVRCKDKMLDAVTETTTHILRLQDEQPQSGSLTNYERVHDSARNEVTHWMPFPDPPKEDEYG